MANEEQINTTQSITTAMQSLTELGVNQINLVLRGIQSLTPVFGTLTTATSDLVVSSVKLIASTAGGVTGALTSAGGTILNAVGSVAGAQVMFLGNIAGSIFSTLSSGVGYAYNSVCNVLPTPRKI